MIKTRFAASLVFAVAAMPALAADDAKSPTDSSRPSTTASATQSQGRQITLTGKIVDLHEYFTGQKDSSGKSDSGIKSDTTRPGTGASDTTRPGTGASDTTRPGTGAADTTRPGTGAADTTRPGTGAADSSHAKSGMKSQQQQYMALTNPSLGTATGATGADATGNRAGSVNVTSSDVVILCFAEAPSVFAVPRSDDRPSATPGTDRPSPTQGTDRPATPGTTTTDRTNTGVGSSSDRSSSDHKDHGQWKDKQVQVTGTMYEKGGMKFLLVSRVSSGSESGSSTRPGTGTGIDRKIDDKDDKSNKNDKNDNK